MNTFGGPQYSPRRLGTNAFIIKFKEYRSLNFGSIRGYFEYEALLKDWRERKDGLKTEIEAD